MANSDPKAASQFAFGGFSIDACEYNHFFMLPNVPGGYLIAAFWPTEQAAQCKVDRHITRGNWRKFCERKIYLRKLENN